MIRKFEKSNEALAILAQRGCEVVREKALDLLLRRNEGLIYDKALTYWNYVNGSDIARSRWTIWFSSAASSFAKRLLRLIRCAEQS